MTWSKILANLFGLLIARLPFPANVVAKFIWEKIEPLIGNDEAPALPSGFSDGTLTAAPQEFKDLIRSYLLTLVSKIDRPFIRLAAQRLVELIADDLLDALWDKLFGKSEHPLLSATAPDELVAAALDEMPPGC